MSKIRKALAAILCLALIFIVPGTAQTEEQTEFGVVISYVNGTLDSPELLAIITVKINNSGENRRKYDVRFDGNINMSHRIRSIELSPGASENITETYIVQHWSDDIIRVRGCWGGHCPFYKRVTVYAQPPDPDVTLAYDNNSHEIVLRVNNTFPVEWRMTGELVIPGQPSTPYNDTFYPALTRTESRKIPVAENSTARNASFRGNFSIALNGKWYSFPDVTIKLPGPEQPEITPVPESRGFEAGGTIFLLAILIGLKRKR